MTKKLFKTEGKEKRDTFLFRYTQGLHLDNCFIIRVT
jgi:hypothetical protein